MDALPRWPFIAHSCANLYWQTLPITLFHNLQHPQKILKSHFTFSNQQKWIAKKNACLLCPLPEHEDENLRKQNWLAKKRMKRSCFFNFRLNMCFVKLSVMAKKCFLLEKIFSPHHQNFSWKRTVSLKFLLKKDHQNRSWKRTTISHHHIRCDLQMDQEWSWNSTLSIR